MKKILFTFAVLLAFTACDNNKPTDTSAQQQDEITATVQTVPFEVAHNYFFKNGQQIPKNPKITRSEQFEQLFGMATTMGANGKPTNIDFNRQMVLAIVLPVTDVATEIIPLQVEETPNELIYTYEVKNGDKQSFTMQPISLIIIDGKYAEHEVILKQK